MNVDWNWIKQRPHFLAMELSKKFDVLILYQYHYNRKGLQDRTLKEENIKPLYLIPRIDRYRCLKWINKVLKTIIVRWYIYKFKAQYVYLTFPDQNRIVPKGFQGKVIYDCMDNHVAFVGNKCERRRMENQEYSLVQQTDFILVSSEQLKQVLSNRYGIKYLSKIFLVRNGFNNKRSELVDDHKRGKEDKFKIAYFGTISSWFNFDYIVNSLETFSNISYVLMGPIDGVSIPHNERIEYIGTVPHEDLYKKVSNYDALIMPFIPNEIIQSVDPVKLYEYINFDKDILCVKYKEIYRFKDFVYFYDDYKSFLEQLDRLCNAPKLKYSKALRKDFLEKNSWKHRGLEINRIVDENE